MENYEKGRTQIKIIIGLMLGLSIITIFVTNIMAGTGELLTHVIRFTLTVLLCYFLYNGKNWARIVIIILSGLATVSGAYGTMLFLSQNFFGVMIFLVYTVVYGYNTITLFSSKYVKEYMSQSNV